MSPFCDLIFFILNQVFAFTVCDSIINCGPVCDITMGESKDLASSSHEQKVDKTQSAQPNANKSANSQKKLVDLVMCCGAGKNGSLCIYQQNIRYIQKSGENIGMFHLKTTENEKKLSF